MARNPGQSYNPLLIYGGAGLGKTHLLHAIGHAAAANHINVICTSAEQFTNEFVNSLREKSTEEFRNKYRSIGMLLIDDIHFISGKEQTEESFFHTFNELHNTNRQIAITSDCPPKAMPLLEERLRSRLEWGLVVDIQPPDFETRLDILNSKAQLKGVNLTPEVMEYIAWQVQQNIRILEGSLNRVVAYARLLQEAPTVDIAMKALEDIANGFKGVEKSFAIQAGREIRILVKPDEVDDLGAMRLARDIVKKIEEGMDYPGQIKVTVLRETRAVDYAK